MKAAGGGELDCVQALLEKGADIAATNNVSWVSHSCWDNIM